MRPDLISIIEAVYAAPHGDGSPHEAAWLQGIAAAAEPALDVGLGTMAYTFTADPETGPTVLEATSRGRYGRELLQSAINMHVEQGAKTMVGFHSQVSLLSDLTRSPPIADRGFVERHLRRVGVSGDGADVLGVVGADSSGQGMVLAALVPRGWQLKPAFRERWRTITSHLASGRRLRTRSESPPDEAVLDLGGKLYDAVGKATSRDARVALRQAARGIDRARAERARAPDAALGHWQALVSGRWSLVDSFESDGRTFLIAKPNPPRPPPVPRLTPRERAVVALAALGRSNKLIAYELGLSLGSVGTYLQRAQRRLGVSSRAALIREFSRAARQNS